MSQRVFVKVVGFSDVERHALNTLFRLSEDRPVTYALWMPDAPATPQLVLVDGEAYEGSLEAESPANRHLKLVWIGRSPPDHAWRTFERPIAWPDVIEAMDELFQPPPPPGPDPDLDFDIAFAESDLDSLGPDTVPPDEPPPRRALIASASLEERLYLRARLTLAQLPLADEAETAGQLLEIARAGPHVVAVVDMDLPGMQPWLLHRELQALKVPTGPIVFIKARPGIGDYVRAVLGGVQILPKPLDPELLKDRFERIAAAKD